MEMASSSATSVTVPILLVAALFIFDKILGGHCRQRYPPGPARLPFVGNIHQRMTSFVVAVVLEIKRSKVPDPEEEG